MEKFGIFDLLSALGTSFGEGEAAPEAREQAQAPAKKEPSDARRQTTADLPRNAVQPTEAARSCEGFLRRHEEISRRIDRNNRG